MHAGRNTGMGREEGRASDGHLEGMRSTLLLHRELIEQKAEIREQPDALSVRLESMAEELDPYDSNTEAIRLLLEAERVRAVQFEELDKCLDQVVDSFMTTMIALLERLRPPGALD